MKTFTTHSVEETISLGKLIGSMLHPGDILILEGTLGVGKTVLTKGIAIALDINENITSPTFCLINEYEGKFKLNHIDVYRLDGVDDFLNLDVEDILYGGGITIIEWGEKVMGALPTYTIRVKFLSSEDGERVVEITNMDDRGI